MSHYTTVLNLLFGCLSVGLQAENTGHQNNMSIR